MTRSNGMSAIEAARKVLQDAECPLHYQEITKRILSAGLWQTNGKTPAATIMSVEGDTVRRTFEPSGRST